MRRSQSCWRPMSTGADDWSAALLDAWREEEQGQSVELVCRAESGGRLGHGKEPNEALHRRLSEVDPSAAKRIHSNDTRRLVRALEVHELTGKPISDHQTEWAEATQRHPALWFGSTHLDDGECS